MDKRMKTDGAPLVRNGAEFVKTWNEAVNQIKKMPSAIQEAFGFQYNEFQ